MFECALGMQYLHGVSSHVVRDFVTDIASHGCGYQRGHIHGSLKPTNILVADNGQACISDYGMVEIKPSGSACARYFSPEAWKGVCPSVLKCVKLLIFPLADNFQTFRRVFVCYELIRGARVYCFQLFQYSKRPQIFTSAPPWGVLSEDHIYKLVVREGDRPDRLQRNIEQKYGLTDKIWGIIEASWKKEATLRPTFTQIVEWWQIRHTEGAPEALRPILPSTSVGQTHSILVQT
jgi:serine/threonine protein kinase